MKEKVKCKKCGLLIDNDLITCPYCGYDQRTIEEEKAKTPDGIESITKEEKPINVNTKREKSGFFTFETNCIELTSLQNLIYFLTGLVGLIFISFFLQLIARLTGSFYFLNSNNSTSAITLSGYLILFGIMLLISAPHLKKFLESFKVKNAILWGLLGGFAVLVISAALNSLLNLIPHQGVNENQESIDSIVGGFPILSVFVLSFLGPICEELTYRVGLFSFLQKRSRILAYIGTSLVFGFIHFSGTGDIINELINLPTYIVAGLIFSYLYEFKGFAASSIAHVANNLFAIVVTIIAAKLG